MNRFYVKASVHDNSYSVFDRGRLNEWGEPYCVHCALTYQQAVSAANKLNLAVNGNR